MHVNNIKWLGDVKSKYPKYFSGVNVLELGSGGGTAETTRGFFEKCHYIGVDIARGVGVEVVCAAKNTQFKEAEFDTLVCLSMFEHDPDWKESFSHNLPYIKKGGLILICWGAEGNLHHGPEPWALVPEKEVIDYLKTLPIKILDNFFEEPRYGLNCAGAYDVLAEKI